MKENQLIIIVLLSIIFSSCNKQSEKLKDKEIELLKKELELEKKEDSISKATLVIEKSRQNEKNLSSNVTTGDISQSDNELIYLKKLGGKYAFEEKLFNKGNLNNRLIYLLKEDYGLFKDNCVTQGEIEVLNNSKLYISCAQPHSYGFEEVFLFIDIDLNLITVAILHDNKVKFFTENSTTNKLNDGKLYTWLNDKIDLYEGIEFSKSKDKYHEFKLKNN